MSVLDFNKIYLDLNRTCKIYVVIIQHATIIGLKKIFGTKNKALFYRLWMFSR